MKEACNNFHHQRALITKTRNIIVTCFLDWPFDLWSWREDRSSKSSVEKFPINLLLLGIIFLFILGLHSIQSSFTLLKSFIKSHYCHNYSINIKIKSIFLQVVWLMEVHMRREVRYQVPVSVNIAIALVEGKDVWSLSVCYQLPDVAPNFDITRAVLLHTNAKVSLHQKKLSSKQNLTRLEQFTQFSTRLVLILSSLALLKNN